MKIISIYYYLFNYLNLIFKIEFETQKKYLLKIINSFLPKK